MRVAAILGIFLMLAAGAVFAQDPTSETRVPPRVDYSPTALRHILSSDIDEPLPRGNVHWRFGVVDFKAFGQPFRVAYLPFLAPLPGSELGTTRQLVDPFALTSTQFPDPPRAYSQRRAHQRLERELRDSQTYAGLR